MEAIIVYVTVPGEEEAVRISRVLLEERLVACVNILKTVRSIYHWEERIEDETEALMVIKTQQHLFERVQARIKGLHPYSVPEIIAVPVLAGAPAYLKWIEEVTGP